DDAATAVVLPSPDDEDTLSGLEAIPVLETAPAPEAKATPSAAPAARRADWGRRAAYLALAVGLLVVLMALALFGLSRAHFVGAEKDGRIAVYQGAPF